MSEDKVRYFERYENDWYVAFGFPLGVVAFVSAWLYAVYAHGFFLGVGLGWLPAIFIGIIAGFLWPFVLLSFITIIVFMLW
ncbi:hypothetical protein J3U99_20755 [Brucella pituitosa]|uniref:hypothetical protein n=1 Tax=Brucella pituitosa TaxID=571256 RepID=UPI002004269A|nr:hypothetical protein [Brucella pituitosa]MCK4207201.1 hypothetical protein [Brucella pituitosa]